MRAHHSECVFPRGVEAKLPRLAYLIQANARKGANEGESRQKREDQLWRRADYKPDPDERINETQKNEVRRFRREVSETFGQSVLEVRRADLAHTIDRGRIRTGDYIRLRHWRSSQTEQQAVTRSRQGLHKAAVHRKPRATGKGSHPLEKFTKRGQLTGTSTRILVQF